MKRRGSESIKFASTGRNHHREVRTQAKESGVDAMLATTYGGLNLWRGSVAWTQPATAAARFEEM